MSLALLDFAFHVSWAAAWFWVLLLIGLVWARRHLALNRADQQKTLSPQDASAPPATLPRLSVLVAAKDEEPNIGRCLSGLLAQHYPGLEVIATNDRSSDRTGPIMDDMAARDARLKPVHVTHLPAGWTGKNHALHQAIGQATGDYFCFTDADCQFHAPELLAAAVCFALREKIDFLSVLPDLEAYTFWERIVQPPAGAIMVFWFPPEKVNNPNSPRAYANGAFMLMSRRSYEALGGHAAAPNALNEDMHFARRAKSSGLRLRVILGGGMYSVRMYVGLRQIWNGWTRIFYCCFGTLPHLLVSVGCLTEFSLRPTGSLLVALGLAAASVAPAVFGGIAGAAALAIVAQQSVLWRFYVLGRTPPAWALTYPIGAAMCLAITINAMRRYAGAATHWRGTSYTGGA